MSGLAAIPAVEVITEAAVLLMTAAAEKLGMTPEGEPQLDLVQARQLITALAGLVAASRDSLSDQHRQPLYDGLTTLQDAFRAASSFPDAPGQGPGENLVF
ncbi:MAG: recombinase RecA [Pseudonocardiales bacterium]|nr:MAG: recombinase RecA [Pseudonocardiales bacterium]